MRTEDVRLDLLDGQSVDFMPTDEGDGIALCLGIMGEDGSSTVLELSQEKAEIMLTILQEYVNSGEYPSQEKESPADKAAYATSMVQKWINR